MSQSLQVAAPGPVTFAGLTEKQSAFVREYVERGGRAGAGPDAAVAAGYAKPGPGGRAAARVRAFELLHNDAVLRVLRDELTRKLNAGAALGVQTLIDLCQNARSEQVRLSAANALIDRGYGPVISRNAVVKAEFTLEDMLDELERSSANSRPSSTSEG